MARRFLPALLIVSVLPNAAYAQDAASKPLQGRWVVTGGEHGGRPMDSLKGGVMTVTGDAFEIRTAGGNMLKGMLKLDASTRPFKMDMVHSDGAVWEAIYENDGGCAEAELRGEGSERPTANGIHHA